MNIQYPNSATFKSESEIRTQPEVKPLVISIKECTEKNPRTFSFIQFPKEFDGESEIKVARAFIPGIHRIDVHEGSFRATYVDRKGLSYNKSNSVHVTPGCYLVKNQKDGDIKAFDEKEFKKKFEPSKTATNE